MVHQSQFIEMTKATNSIKLEDVAKEVFAGGDKPKDHSAVRSEQYKYPVFSNGIGDKALLCFSKECRVKEAAITVSARGTIGYAECRDAGFTPVVRLLTLIPKEGYQLAYLKFALNSITFHSTGSSQGQLTAPDFCKYEIPNASFGVQNAFGSIVQQADKSKFAGFKSQFIEILNSSEKKVAIGDVLSLAQKGKTPQYVEHSNVRVMNQACVHWDGIHWENVKYQDPGKLSNKEALKSFDILLNSTGTGTLGRCNIFFKPDDDYTYIPDGHLTVLNTNRAVMRPWLLVYFIKLEDVQREIYDDCVTGSTNQVDLVRKNFLRIRIPLPDMASQIWFDNIVAQADKSKYLN